MSEVTYGRATVTRRESMRISRNTLADLAGITRGRMWAIEHDSGKPPSDHERNAIDVALRNAPEGRVPVQTKNVTSPKAKRSPTNITPTTSLSRAAVGVHWPSLVNLAATVSPHDLDKYAEGPNPDAGFRLFSNSEVQTFKACRRKWWLAYHRGLRLRRVSPIGPLMIGDRIHRALRAYYVPDGYERTDPRDAIERIIADDWEKVKRLYSEDDPELLVIHKKFTTESDLERIMMEGYVAWLAETGIDSELQVIQSEAYLEAVIPLGDDAPPTKIIGKIDTRVRRRIDDVRLFIDHKSLASITRPRPTLHLDEQMLHYHLLELLAALESDTRCDGALYNMLRKVKRSVTAKPPFYERVEVRHSTREIEAFRRRLIATLRQILDVETRLNNGEHHLDVVYPTPSQDCSWKCDFFPVCPMFDDGSRAEDMLDAHYVKHDVLSYYRMNELDEGVLNDEC